MIAGPNNFSNEKISCTDAGAFNPKDKVKILDYLSTTVGVDRVNGMIEGFQNMHLPSRAPVISKKKVAFNLVGSNYNIGGYNYTYKFNFNTTNNSRKN